MSRYRTHARPVPFCTLAVAAMPIRRGDTTREAAAVYRLLRVTGDTPAFSDAFWRFTVVELKIKSARVIPIPKDRKHTN
jgi:hypothetical protein